MPTRAGVPTGSSALGRKRVTVVAVAASDPAAPVMDDGMGGRLPARRGVHGRAAGAGEEWSVGAVGARAGRMAGWAERLSPTPFGQGG